MPKRRYLLAILCYILIPVAVLAGAAAHRLIDPEMARTHANYTRDYQLLEMTRTAALMAAAGLACVLWGLCCYFVLRSRERSARWLSFGIAGPLGFSVIAALEDRAPSPGDRYQRFIRRLKPYWRVPLELALFVAVWTLTYNVIVF